MFVETLIKSNAYYDSLVLMHLSSSLERFPSVQKAIVMMGTPENQATVKDKTLLTDEVMKASPNDLFIVVSADTEAAAKSAISHAIDYLENKGSAETAEAFVFRTLDAAIINTPSSNLVSISLPGKYAGAEAKRALVAGRNVFLFSDNVPLDVEIELKQLAIARKCLLMGPDCGTAILRGTALGFANAVRKGNIGVVGASGTGIQEVTTLIHRLGAGVSQAIGTGSRDISSAINGMSLISGLKWLANDPETSVILIVSKPPADDVKDQILEIVQQIQKPVVVNLLGAADNSYQFGNTFLAETMEDAAEMAVFLARHGDERKAKYSLYDDKFLKRLALEEHKLLRPQQKHYRGLFSGGTYANEAAMILKRELGNVFGNISLPGVMKLEDVNHSVGHTCVDMGDDVFTVGKPHPILAPSLRRERMLEEAADNTAAVIYVDIVLGYGCHPNPAEEFGQYIEEAKALAAKDGRHLPVITYVAGVEEDPQVYSAQVDTLRKSGAIIAPTNAAATRLAVGIITGNYPELHELSRRDFSYTGAQAMFQAPYDLHANVNVINIGLTAFVDSLREQSVPVTHVDFHPPAGGSEAMAEILAELL